MPRKSWWARLPFAVRMTAGASALLVLIGGGAAGVATLTVGGGVTAAAEHGAAAEPDLGAPTLDDDPEVVSRAAAAAEPLPQRHTPAPAHARSTTAPATDQLSRARAGDARADRTGPRSPRTSAAKKERVAPAPARPPAPAAPDVTTRTDVETRPIPFPTRLVRDPSLPRGAKRVQTPGVPGEETLRYLVTVIDGKAAHRRLVDATVTRKPEPRVVAFGARRKDGKRCEQTLCVPLGRSAPCPDERAGRAPGKPDGKAASRQEGQAAAGHGRLESQAAAGHGTHERQTAAGHGEREAREAREESTAVQLGGSVLLSEEDLELLTPETLDDVRLEPATLC